MESLKTEIRKKLIQQLIPTAPPEELNFGFYFHFKKLYICQIKMSLNAQILKEFKKLFLKVHPEL